MHVLKVRITIRGIHLSQSTKAHIGGKFLIFVQNLMIGLGIGIGTLLNKKKESAEARMTTFQV